MRFAPLLALLLAPLVHAGPGYVPIQGVLADNNGVAIDGNVSLSLTLYSDSSGSTSLWTDTVSVDVTSGAFATELGAGSIPLDLQKIKADFGTIDFLVHSIAFADKDYLKPEQFKSFASILKENGYATAMVGKWQLSFLQDHDTVRDFGFDEYLVQRHRPVAALR